MPDGQQADQQGVFVLGLTMAGAISGGAYTAGVLSFLAEALDAWEAERKKRETPQHRVVLKAISGASAGGICGALGAVALAEDVPNLPSAPLPTGMAVPRGEAIDIPTALPRLYAAWVQGPCLVAPNGSRKDLLDARDLERVGSALPALCSLLDSTRLQDVADAAVAPARTRPRRAWIDPRLHLFLTHTDMRGVPYRIAFAGAQAWHGMLSHADRVHYVLSLGDAEQPNPTAVEDNAWLLADTAAIGLDIAAELGKPKSAGLVEFATAALATSAFPLGFTARSVAHKAADWDSRPMPLENSRGYVGRDGAPWLTLAADWSRYAAYASAHKGSQDLPTAVWDGGCLDNEPFEYARWAIMAEPPAGNPQDGREATRAVLMIDPFPEDPPLPEFAPGGMSTALAAVLGRAKSAFINSARFKPAEIAAALDDDRYSRFLIAPVRDDPKNTGRRLIGADAIASGGLGGFGGTIHEAFRLHDFQLGRYNCQQFLREHFTLPPDNGLVWPGGPPPGPRANRAKNDVREAPIIPLCGAAEKGMVLPPWPCIDYERDLDELAARIGERADAVVDHLRRRDVKAWPMRLLLRIGWWGFGRGAVREQARWRVFRELLARDQIDGWPDKSGTALARLGDTERRILCLLADPGWDGRSAASLAAALSQVKLLHERGNPAAVPDALRGLELAGRICRFPGRPGAWCLAPRAPDWFARNVKALFSPLRVG